MQYFPLFLDLTNKPVLVVGGGEVASRKVEALLRANASVTIVSPELTSYLKEKADNGQLTWLQSHYRENCIENHIQVWATTNNAELNHQVYKDAKKQNILVNVVDDKPYCDFITPSMVNRGKIQIAISSGGGSPVLVRNIREKIERVLSHNTGLLAEFAASKRDDIKIYYDTVEQRRLFWEAFFANDSVELAENKQDLESVYDRVLAEGISVTLSQRWLEYGNDVELISIKSLRYMQEAEWVISPEECPFEFIDLCRRDAERMTYSNLEGLREILKSASEHNMSNICIFIQKGRYDTDEALRTLIADDRIQRVIG